MAIGRQIVHRLAVGVADISGDDFGVIFARAIGGEHKGKPFGIADVTWENCAWSVKTVKSAKPFTQKRVRLISGRNSPIYSADLSDPFADIQATGATVLNVWNDRVDQSLNEHDDLRIFVMIRNMSTQEFTLMEYEAGRYVAQDYEWSLNKSNNFIGHDKRTGEHAFTWQPHGSQFTILRHVSASAYRFRIAHKPGLIEATQVLNSIKFEDDWIQAVPPPAKADGKNQRRKKV